MRFARAAECVQLNDSHIAGAYALSSLAGWNQTPDDWRTLLEFSDACYGIEFEGQLVATTTLVCYGRKLGWIGMVLTHPDFRRRGFARKLMGQAVEQTKTLGIQTLKLDATDQGRPLYETFGFLEEQPVERWQHGPHAGKITANDVGSLSFGSSFYDLDAESCGYDRRSLLARLASRSDAFLSGDAYALSRPGHISRYFGPCVASSEADARYLILEAMARRPDTGWFWDLLPANDRAATIARGLGFVCVRKLTRMTWGREFRGKEEQVFAIGGFEFG